MRGWKAPVFVAAILLAGIVGRATAPGVRCNGYRVKIGSPIREDAVYYDVAVDAWVPVDSTIALPRLLHGDTLCTICR